MSETKKFPNYKKLNPLGHLPKFTKDPKNFDTIQKALYETVGCPKGHSEPAQMFDCKACQQKTLERRSLMKKFGFRSAAEYMQWRKIMEVVQKRVHLAKYNESTTN